jgi:hypothetical protein
MTLIHAGGEKGITLQARTWRSFSVETGMLPTGRFCQFSRQRNEF